MSIQSFDVMAEKIVAVDVAVLTAVTAVMKWLNVLILWLLEGVRRKQSVWKVVVGYVTVNTTDTPSVCGKASAGRPKTRH